MLMSVGWDCLPRTCIDIYMKILQAHTSPLLLLCYMLLRDQNKLSVNLGAIGVEVEAEIAAAGRRVVE